VIPEVRRYPVDDNTEPEEGTVSTPTETIDFVRIAADALDDKKGMDIALLDVGDLLSITEVFVIVTGTSRPHVRTLAEAVDEKLKEHGRRPLRTEGAAEGEWVLLDYGDFVVHVFQETPRDFYGLERLWGDAPRIQWEPAVHSES
jgi:ribosome-associated protein